MRHLPKGKGIYIWQIPRCGSVTAIADLAQASGIEHVFIKISDGIATYNVVNGVDLAKQLSDALKARNIEPWGWGYCYSLHPAEEAAMAIKRVKDTGVIGFDIDAEGECKGRPVQVTQYSQALRKGLLDLPIGLGSYRFPSIHPELPWHEFRVICDFDMPQVYWVEAHNPGEQLQKSWGEFHAMKPGMPYIPTGSAYKEEYPPYWIPTPAEIKEFIATTKTLPIDAYNFWEWYDARVVLPQLWDACFGDVVVPPPPPPAIPKVVKTIASSLYLRSKPYGTVVGYIPYGTLLKVNGVMKDGYGKDWYQVGLCYCASWWCEAVE